MRSDGPLISVVVPTYRRPDLLERCLRALLAQDLPPSCFEVIVADDAGCQETRCQISTLAAATRERGICLRYVCPTGMRGPAAARNAGWRAARGHIIAFTDDDCIPAPDWLRRGLAAFGPIGAGGRSPVGVACVDGAWGRIVVPLPAVPTDYQRNAAQLAHAELVTANCFYRREALAAVGGFDERFALAWREDSDLHFRLMARGARLVAAQDALVTHPVRPAPWGISVRQQRKSLYNALLYRKHPRLYRKHIQTAPPWRYYATVGTLAGVALGLLSARRRLSLLSGGLWLGLSLEFCARRLRGTSRAPAHIAEMVVTSLVIPPLAIFWRLRGALKFRVWFF
jgi:cellulose synthase/poly-beta-1,6-N-acetylglucosamine synthase-like glycosyltransferase